MIERVMSPREARLLFWLVAIALVTLIVNLGAGFARMFAGPALIVFIAWLMSYVLEPPVSWLQRHLPTKGRGIPVLITYLVTFVIAAVVLLAVAFALFNAAVQLVDNMPTIVQKLGDALRPVFDWLGIELPDDGSVVAAIQAWLVDNAAEISQAIRTVAANAVTIVASLITAVFISVGLAVGQVSLFGWARRFLPERSYHDLTELEGAIAVSFGGFVRGRLLIGGVYGAIVGIGAVLLGVPLAPLITVVAGLIVFIPWIGPLIGWTVLPAFAALLAPDVVVPALVISLLGAVVIQLLVTQFVMGAAVNMSPVAVFTVVIIGTALAGIPGAIFAIPTAAAILAITDYLRQRDVLLRSGEETAEEAADRVAGVSHATSAAGAPDDVGADPSGGVAPGP